MVFVRISANITIRVFTYPTHSNLNDLVFHCKHNQAGCIVRMGFAEQVFAVFFHCSLADKQFFANLLVVLPLADQPEDLELTFGKALDELLLLIGS